jgi:NAD-dependent deacetylase
MTPPGFTEAVNRAREILRNARHAVAFTGAGISTPSGIPDFRSKNTGMWEHDNPMETASLTIFRSNPQRFWDWKRPLMLRMWAAQPNPAHLALASLERAGILKAVITQNIDGLHQRAGSQQVFEVHGTIETIHCPHCQRRWPSLDFKTILEEDGAMPRCPKDQTVLKPDVVLFEEALPQHVWQESEAHCVRADVMLVVGSSLEVYPAGYIPGFAAGHGASVIVANLSPTYVDPDAAVLLPYDVAVTLPAIAENLC